MSSFFPPAPLSICPPSTLYQIASPTPPPSVSESVTDDELKPDGLDMLNATLQLHWADRLGNSLRFKGISVYLIYWAKNIDELKCADEVLELEKFFRTKFGYKTHLIEIQSCERADLQVQMDLAKLIYDNDDEDNLHIVYYAGHGVPKNKACDEIALVPRSDPSVRAADFLHLQWMTIEQTLAKAHGHRLCILDCCYSGNIARSVIAASQDHRNFEILSASSYGGTTRGPGKHSFTSALMWALESLLDEFGDRGFTTTHLRLRVREAPDFPKTQHPAPIKEINAHARSRIVLHPLNRPHSTKFSSGLTSVAYSPSPTLDCSIGRYAVNLRFLLEDKPDKAKIDELAASVKRCSEEVMGLYGIGWDGLERVGSAQRTILERYNKVQRADFFRRKYSKPFLALLKSRKSTSDKDIKAIYDTEDGLSSTGKVTGELCTLVGEESIENPNEGQTTTIGKANRATREDGIQVLVKLSKESVTHLSFLGFNLVIIICIPLLIAFLMRDSKPSKATSLFNW